MRNTAWLLAVSISLGFGTNACAGFLDKLNEASQKIKQVSQQIPQTKSSAPTSSAGEDPDKPLHLEDHYKGSCEGKRSATCNAERAAINKEHADFNNKIIREYNNRPSGL